MVILDRREKSFFVSYVKKSKVSIEGWNSTKGSGYMFSSISGGGGIILDALETKNVILFIYSKICSFSSIKRIKV